MKTLTHYLTAIAAIALTFLGWVPLANAHPLGNFTINHYAGLEVTQAGIGVDYVLDMAEIPAFQEINRLDTNRDRTADSTETVSYPTEQCHKLSGALNLRVSQQPVALALKDAAVEFPPGVGGLATLRLTCAFAGAIATTQPDQSVEFADTSYSHRLGWREITVATTLPIQGNVTATSITKRLTEYPTDLLSSPLNQQQVTFQLNPSTAIAQTEPPSVAQPSSSQALTGRSNNAFTRLITLEQLNLPTMLLALVIAFIWGGIHALSPGHGKTIVGAYLVGARSQVRHALVLGLTVTLTHTAGIFALGLLTLSTSQFILTEELYPWLSGLSGVLVTAIGGNLFIRRLRSAQGARSGALASHTPHHHDHQHHHHDHVHSHAHHSHAHHSHAHDDHKHHGHGQHTHSHLPPGADGSPVTWSSILALGISGGILPCPSALVVLLSAIALGRVGFGLVLVSAFSLGLAAVLTGIGLLLVYAKERFEQFSFQSPQSQMLPALSALVITLIGIGITTQALLIPTL